jgi:hypothetical protein
MAHINTLAAYERSIQLTLVVEKFVPPHHLMCLGILFLLRRCMYDEFVRFDTSCLIPFVSLFSTLIYMMPVEKRITTLQFINPLDLEFCFLNFIIF